jgi:hypothetical protein
MFPRKGVFYMQDTTTGKQTSLRTKDETEARSLLNAENEAHRQPVLNLQLARAYLSASDPAFPPCLPVAARILSAQAAG